MLRLTSVQLFDHMNDGVLVLERDWSISYCNARAVAAFGGRDLKGQILWDVFPHAQGTRIEYVYRRAFQTGQSEACEFYSHDLSTWFEVRAIPVKEELAVLFRDINEKRLELGRAEARRRALDALFDQVFLGIMQVDSGSRPMLANDHLCTLTGRSRHELLTSAPSTWMAPEDAALFSSALAATDVASTWEANVRLIRPDGTVRHCSLQLSRVMEGNVHSHSIIVLNDITERLSAEARLREREERYRLAARATKDAIWDWDLASGQVTWNPAIEELCGDHPSPHAAWWEDRIHPEDRGSVMESIEAFRTSESERWEHEYRFRRADGSYAHVLDRGFLVRNETGEPVRMIGAMVDMSERVEAYQRLNELQTELIHVSRVSAMGTMASALAHELNQPLTGIANYVSGARLLLQEKDATAIDAVLPVLADAADEVIKASELIRRLRRMVARGQVEVQTVELDALIRDALSLAIPNSRLARVEIEISVVGASVLGDPIQVQQVLVNLIRNAVEAMEERPVKRLELWSERLEGVYRLYVRDTGTGMPPQIAERLFTPFTTTKPDGLGVGLMISRTILEAHGGAISLFETGPQGTTMLIDMPAS